MDIERIRTLIELMEEKDLVSLEVTEGKDSISLTRHYDMPMLSTAGLVSPLSNDPPTPSAVKLGSIETSPMVGVFYVAPSPNDPPFLVPGQKIQAGDTLGIIEAMKIMNPLEATQSGIVDAILVEDGDVVQFGQPIIRYKN